MQAAKAFPAQSKKVLETVLCRQDMTDLSQKCGSVSACVCVYVCVCVCECVCVCMCVCVCVCVCGRFPNNGQSSNQ